MSNESNEVYPEDIHDMYVNQQLSIKEIAEKTGMAYRDLLLYVQEKGWIAELRTQQVEAQQRATTEFIQHIGDNRTSTAKNHLAIGQMLMSLIEQKVKDSENNEYLSAGELLNMSKALKEVSDVQARSVALSDKNFEGLGAEMSPPKAHQPLISVGVKPKALKEPKAIDITSEVIVEEDPF